MKHKPDFIKQAKAFLDLIGYTVPARANQFQMARYWVANQEDIVNHIPRENTKLKPHFNRMFVQITISARYFSELKPETSKAV